MKHYKNALLALEQDSTPNSKQNKFAKISLDTEDTVLKSLTKAVADMYKHYIEHKWSRTVPPESIGKIPRYNSEWREMQTKVNTELKEYLKTVLGNKKPEWQVMAERNGWEPVEIVELK